MSAAECPHCGLSLKEFHRSGRLGCSECYQVFEDELSRVLRRLHGSDQHTGKSLNASPYQLEARKTLIDLRRRLKRAIEREEFEQAAALRDRINAIEQDSALNNVPQH